MIVDKIENIGQYAAMGIDTERVAAFVAQYQRQPLPEGRYDMEGDDLFALVQKYETRDWTGYRPESHLQYHDLQVIVSGQEILLWDFTGELPVMEDRTPLQDIRFHAQRPEKGKITMEAGMFALLTPEDAHTPCLRIAAPCPVEKIVFKIRVKD